MLVWWFINLCMQQQQQTAHNNPPGVNQLITLSSTTLNLPSVCNMAPTVSSDLLSYLHQRRELHTLSPAMKPAVTHFLFNENLKKILNIVDDFNSSRMDILWAGVWKMSNDGALFKYVTETEAKLIVERKLTKWSDIYLI